jgi:short-subunit dehydrogenase
MKFPLLITNLVLYIKQRSMSKNIVITGASRGIGRAIAIRYARAGYRVAVCSRDASKLAQLQQEIKAVSPAAIDHLFTSCDMADKAQVLAFGKQVLAQMGAIDILVNNAGTYLPGQVVSEPEGTLERLIETNLYSAYYMTRVLAPAMIAQQSGYIFNICSVASLAAYPNGGSYSISKFALLGFSKALREELKATGVKVTSVLPGATLTDSWAGVDLPESRFMKVEDIADTIWDVSQLSSHTVIEEILLRPQAGDI